MVITRRRGTLRRLAAALAVLVTALVVGLTTVPSIARADDLTAPVHTKSVSDTPDENGQYTLTLDVVGKSQSSSENRPVDVIFVLDTSNSMNRQMLSLIHISEPTRHVQQSRMPSSA